MPAPSGKLNVCRQCLTCAYAMHRGGGRGRKGKCMQSVFCQLVEFANFAQAGANHGFPEPNRTVMIFQNGAQGTGLDTASSTKHYSCVSGLLVLHDARHIFLRNDAVPVYIKSGKNISDIRFVNPWRAITTYWNMWALNRKIREQQLLAITHDTFQTQAACSHSEVMLPVTCEV